MPNADFMKKLIDNRDEIMEQASAMTIRDFCVLNNIGTSTYYLYFQKTSHGAVLLKDHVEQRERAVSFDVSEFKKKKRELAEKFGVDTHAIDKLMRQGYTISEIEKGTKNEDGTIKVTDIFKYYM